MKQYLLLVAGWFLFATTGFSQQVFNDYESGRIYIKMKSFKNPKTGQAFIPGYKWDLNKLPFYYPVDKKYGITKLDRAFHIEANETLNSTLVLEFTNNSLVNELIEVLKTDPFVEYAEKIPVDRLFLTPNDPQLPNQWHLAKIGAVSAWNYASSGSNIVIAIVDDAIERNHPDLSPNVWVNPGEIPGNGIDDDSNGYIDDINGWDVAGNTNQVDPPNDQYNHGTHVAGIAGAATNNGIGVSSIGFSCKLMCVKATNSANSISHGYQGVLYAANSGAHIISMSWGSGNVSITGENVINYALGKGCILVASAGNDDSPSQRYPAAYQGVISVAATAADDSKSSFSNYGSWVKISAPGSSVRSTTVNASYGNLSGTSMATPMVSGLLGLMKYLNPNMPNADLVNCLYNTADDISAANAGYNGQMGSGRINAAKAMECVAGSLNSPPISDFTASATTVAAGGQVTFTDQSSYNPTGWQWSFPGGSPAVFTGKSPPAVQYNTPGQYTVSLTASNSFGQNIATKTNLITVNVAPTCLTVNLPVPQGWEAVNYGAGQDGIDGFVNGTNVYGERQKAMFFNLFSTNNTTLTSVAIDFGTASSLVPGRIVPIRVFDGTTSSPGTQLGVYNLTMAQIIADVQNNRLTLVDFPQSITLPASKAFFVSVDISNLQYDNGNGDKLSIISNSQGQSNANFIWDQGPDLVWRRYGTAGTWNLTQASLFIHPFVTPNPAKSVLNPKNPVICSGNVVEFSGAGSTYGDAFQWQFPGAASSIMVNNQLQVSTLYTAAGSYKAYLLTRGGCQEIRIDSTVITVNAVPTITINATKSPICAGESATLTASGATSYSWSPATGLSATTGASVVANPTQTIAYNITATQGNCSTSVPYELEVKARTTDVGLVATQTALPGPTQVTFTATPFNGGGNPTFNFFVNDISVQSGPGSQLIRTVSPADKVKCRLTSSEPCVDEKTVESNIIVLTEGALPISLFSFTGKKASNGNTLQWITGSEANSDRFVIERSADGISFSPIGEVVAAGNSAANRNYQFADTRPPAGKNYYRLKMLDKDGTFRYSNVVMLDATGRILISQVQPNPSVKGAQALLVIQDANPGMAEIVVTHVTGQVIKSFRINNTTGSMQITLPSSGFASGNYFVSYRNSKGEVLETVKWTIIQ